MSDRATDRFIENIETKPATAAAHAERKVAYKISRARKEAQAKLLGRGFLIPKTDVLLEGLQELREAGHAHADKVEKTLRRS